MSASRHDAAALRPYVLQAVALGLDLETSRRSLEVEGVRHAEPKPRRPSLSQRLGLQSLTERGSSPASEATARSPSPATDGQTKAAETPEAQGSGVSQQLVPSPSQSPSPAPGPKQRAIKIECVDIAGNDIYVGTSNGQIVHFTTETPEIDSARTPDHFKVQTVDLKMGGKR
ncbi:hypothetical protein LPJ61_006271, partial [Coemansia biformis]